MASIPMPAGFVPNVTVANPSSLLVGVISYSSPNVQIIDASNDPGDLNSNTVIAAFKVPVSGTVNFGGLTCMICAAVFNPLSGKLLMSTADGYFEMDMTAGTATALPFAGALPSPSFSLNPLAAAPYIISSTFGQKSSPGEVQILDLTTNAVANLTNLGLTEPYATPIDLLSNNAAVVDLAAADQALLGLVNPESPTSALVTGLETCAGPAPLGMATLGVSSLALPTLYLGQVSGSCFGFEQWNVPNVLDFTIVPYGYWVMPATPDAKPFVNGSDPNTIANFNSVVDKKNYGVLVDASQNWIAKINPQVPLMTEAAGGLPAGLLFPAGDLVFGAALAVNYFPTPASVVTLSQTNINFGTQAAGTPSAPNLITLTNVGPNLLSISQIAVQGPNASDFAESDTCTANPTLAPLAKCTIQLIFTPSATGSLNATLSITDNGGASPQIVLLSGTGM